MKTKAVKAILRLVADAESARSVDSYRVELLAALATAFPCDVVVFNEFQIDAGQDPRATPTATCTLSPALEPAGAINPALCAAFVRHLFEHPLIREHAAGDRSSRRLSDVTSMRSFRRLALYGEFFRPAAIDHQLTVGLEGPPGRLVGVMVNRGGRDFSDDELLLAELLRPQLQAAELAARRAAARAALTQREREVLDLVAAGATNAVVAEALIVSPATVKKHLDNIYAKLGVGSRAAAADRAHNGGAAASAGLLAAPHASRSRARAADL